MKLTREILHSAGTEGCGFNLHQLKLLGVDWPPPKGWLNGLVGTEISDEKWNLILSLKGVRNRRQRKMILAQV